MSNDENRDISKRYTYSYSYSQGHETAVTDVIDLYVFGTHLTDGLTVSVSIWRLAPLITVRDLQLVGMPSFTRYFAKMT